MSATAPLPVAIIDDDASLCRSLGRLLRLAGFRPLTFASAEDFLHADGRAALRCLLIDIQLGGISGIALHRLLLAAGDRTPVIFITAQEEPAMRSEALRAGCAGFFRKTDDGRLIIAALRTATAASALRT